VIDWIWNESTTRPSFSISVDALDRTVWVSLLRSRMSSSTVSSPTIVRSWPCESSDTAASISSCLPRKRRAALAIDGKSSPTLKMTTPSTRTGIDCDVTPVICSGTLRRSSESLRTVWTRGRTKVPLPEMILKPSDSATAASRVVPFTPKPEMISASFGSATRYITFRATTSSTSATTTAIAMGRMVSMGSFP
jgi:hypothetical protein